MNEATSLLAAWNATLATAASATVLIDSASGRREAEEAANAAHPHFAFHVLSLPCPSAAWRMRNTAST